MKDTRTGGGAEGGGAAGERGRGAGKEPCKVLTARVAVFSTFKDVSALRRPPKTVRPGTLPAPSCHFARASPAI